MKNSWRVILIFSQNSLGKQFRNDLMMLRGYCTTSRKNKTKHNKNKKQKQKQTKKKCFVLYLKININAFLKNNIYASYSKLSVQGTQNSIKI